MYVNKVCSNLHLERVAHSELLRLCSMASIIFCTFRLEKIENHPNCVDIWVNEINWCWMIVEMFPNWCVFWCGLGSPTKCDHTNSAQYTRVKYVTWRFSIFSVKIAKISIHIHAVHVPLTVYYNYLYFFHIFNTILPSFCELTLLFKPGMFMHQIQKEWPTIEKDLS